MKRFFAASPFSIVTALIGLLAASLALVSSRNLEPTPRLFDVKLEPIKVKPFRRPPNEPPFDYFLSEFPENRVLVGPALRNVENVPYGGSVWNSETGGSQIPPKTVDELIKLSDDRVAIRRYKGAPLAITRARAIDDRIGFAGGYKGRGDIAVVFRTDDGGSTWREILRKDPGGGVNEMLVADADTVFVSFTPRDLFRTLDGGQTWTKLIDSDLFPVAGLDRAPDGRLWMVGDNSVRVSDDLGATWTVVSSRMTVMNRPWTDIAFSPNGMGVVVADDGSIAITEDNGQTWSPASSNLHVNSSIPLPNDEWSGKESFYDVQLVDGYGLIRGRDSHYLMTIR
jgi:hypothetical protein